MFTAGSGSWVGRDVVKGRELGWDSRCWGAGLTS